jgi:DNA polymerase IV (family X)
MKNQKIAQILFEIGDLLDLQEVPFKPEAYKKAAIAIDLLEDDISSIYEKEGLKGLEKLKELVKALLCQLRNI